MSTPENFHSCVQTLGCNRYGQDIPEELGSQMKNRVRMDNSARMAADIYLLDEVQEAMKVANQLAYKA